MANKREKNPTAPNSRRVFFVNGSLNLTIDNDFCSIAKTHTHTIESRQCAHAELHQTNKSKAAKIKMKKKHIQFKMNEREREKEKSIRKNVTLICTALSRSRTKSLVSCQPIQPTNWFYIIQNKNLKWLR